MLCAGWPQLAKAAEALEERERCQLAKAARLLRNALARRRCRTDGIADHYILLCAVWATVGKAATGLEERERCLLGEHPALDEVDTIHGFEACATALAGVGLGSTWPKA